MAVKYGRKSQSLRPAPPAARRISPELILSSLSKALVTVTSPFVRAATRPAKVVSPKCCSAGIPWPFAIQLLWADLRCRRRGGQDERREGKDRADPFGGVAHWEEQVRQHILGYSSNHGTMPQHVRSSCCMPRR